MPKLIMPTNHETYRKAREAIGVSNYALAPILGVSLRQAQRWESGEAPVPEPIAKLMWFLQRDGIPSGW